MNYNKKTIMDVDVAGKKILLRCDFNVPQDKATGAITSDKRIVAALPTIRYLLERGAAVIAAPLHVVQRTQGILGAGAASRDDEAPRSNDKRPLSESTVQVRQEVRRQAEYGRRVRLIFQHEGRFCLLGTPRQCWVPRGSRPIVGARLNARPCTPSPPSARTMA